MTTRTDLIEKLQALEPSEGEWKIEKINDEYERIMCNKNPLYNCIFSTRSDDTLITLAPLMRTEILRMDEEMKRLEKANKFLEDARMRWSELATKLKKENEFLNQRIESLLKQLKDGSPF
jgi:hypothetical protein